MKRICFYSPYLPAHFGGGEKYILDCARVAAELIHNDVFVAIPYEVLAETDEQTIRSRYEAFLGVSLEQVRFIGGPLGSSQASWWQKMLWTKQWDVLYYLTDGSLFFSLAGRNILHIQIPFVTPPNWLTRLKLFNWQVRNTNSEFTKQVIESRWHEQVDVVHQPMIEYQGSSPADLKKKQKIILNVGRFFRQLHSKRQDILVKMFAELIKKFPKETKGWQLILVGSVEDESYAAEVKKMSRGLPIKLIHDASHQQLWDWYQQASIYWHASGFDVDQIEHPEKVEHFGISTVEAMSAGCVPVVIAKGGQPEILGKELADLLWQTQAECLTITGNLLKNPKKRLHKAELSQKRAETFGYHQFRNKLAKMLEV